VAVVHHVLSDGIGGLAVLAALVDGAHVPRPTSEPAPMPSLRELFADATSSRLRVLTMLPERVRRLRAGLAELAPGTVEHAPRTSLNRPTGRRRRLAVVRVDLTAVHDGARSHGGTVNDAIVTAAAGALHATCARRGDDVESLVVSMPVSARRETSASRLGNEVGTRPLSLT